MNICEVFEVDEFVRHYLAPEELRERASEMAQSIIEGQRAAEELTSIKSQYKAKIDGIAARVALKAQEHRDGYVLKTMKCPASIIGNLFEVRHPETNEVIISRPATDRDKQVCLDFGSRTSSTASRPE